MRVCGWMEEGGGWEGERGCAGKEGWQEPADAGDAHGIKYTVGVTNGTCVCKQEVYGGGGVLGGGAAVGRTGKGGGATTRYMHWGDWVSDFSWGVGEGEGGTAAWC